MRLGVYGGTFDPVHDGHLAVAARLSTRFRFDRLLFVPATVPPHKRGREIAHPAHRVAMLALAVQGRPDWTISTVEIDCEPPHYSVDTVARLNEAYPRAAPLYFVIGADSFEDLPLWRDYLRLVESCHIIVTARPGYRLDAAHLAEAARRKLVDLRGTDPADVPPRPPGAGTAIYLTDDAFVDVSATAVRERARRGEPLAGMVPDAVAEYIQKQELYDTKPDE
jgi:nicotinate-nucleotide adenylyltransferase